MESFKEASNKGIDDSAGALVWVQRRNGTWWPGKILGPDEVPVSCLVSPKPGTPVKLLGREDLNLEWYDLEKSKHVKAFRCGEYDKCIEKAKATAAKVSKKMVKYARREDAIILALEIENARLGKNDQEQHYQESSKVELDSELELSKSGVSFEDPDLLSASKEQSSHEKPRRNPSGSEDDGTKGVKRMRGLDDLGSQVAPNHGSRKKKNRQKPLTKVLESNTMVSIPSSPTGLSPSGAPDSKVSGSKLENGSSDKLCDVPLATEEMQSAGSPILSCTSQKSHAEAVSFVSDELNESGSTASGAAAAAAADIMDSIINPRTTMKCAAEWQSKGKRNLRYTVRIIHQEEEEDRFMDTDEKSDGYLVGYNSEIRVNKLGGWTRLNQKPQFTDELWLQKRLLPYRQSRSTLNPKYDPSDFLICHPNGDDDSLYDVKVEVESSSCCRPQHVPFISLMSKSSGRPITGHPLEVEVLEDGLSWINGTNNYAVEMMPNSPCKTRYKRVGGRRPRKHQTLKSSPRKNGALTKKTRKLSSLNGLDNYNKQMDDEEDEKHRMEIKFKKSAAVVCCVPLKVVFSRMNAALS